MDADRLSSNAVFPQIMSFLDWKSVNCCKLVNRSINKCIQREWRTIQRRKANIEITSITNGGIYLYSLDHPSAVDLVAVTISFVPKPGSCLRIWRNPYSCNDVNVQISSKKLVVYGDRAEAFKCLLQQCQESEDMRAEWTVSHDESFEFSAECTIDDHLITIEQVLSLALSAISINNVVISETPEEDDSDEPDDDFYQNGLLSLDQLRVIKDCFWANKQKSNPMSTELSILDEEHLQLYRIIGSDSDKLEFPESRRNDWLDCSIGQMDLQLRNAEVMLRPQQFTSLLPLQKLLQEWSSAKRRIKRLTVKNFQFSDQWIFENEDWRKILPRSIVQQKYNKTDCTLEGVLQRPADGRYLSFKFERNIYVFEEIISFT